MLTQRGRTVLAAGLAIYVAAWAFGSMPLYPVAVGLLLAVAAARVWVRVLDKPMRLRRVGAAREHVEGEDVSVVLDLEHEGRVRPVAIDLVDRLGGLGEFEVGLSGNGGDLSGRYVIPSLPRGRYAFESAVAVLEDPFGLERTEVALETPGALLVYPRLAELDGLFSEAGAHAQDGRRLLLRRPSGFDLHSVREYEQGESLRKVHWRSTARRGQLMVKELEDAPRDEVAVLLDASAGAVVGEPPDSSFDMQVRAAGSILRAHVRRGRRAVLVVNSAAREEQGLRGDDGDWRRALDVLAAVQPTGRAPAAALVGEAGAAGRALELTVVTAELAPQLVERLVHRAGGRRGTALVYVDAASFGARPPRRREPALLRLRAAGIPVAVLARGDDLAAKLGGSVLVEAAGG